MKYRNLPRALIPFYVLVIYIFAQFFWWAYLLYSQSRELIENQLTIAIGQNDVSRQTFLHEELGRKFFMILGEGGVFMVLMLVGIFQVRKAFRKEADLQSRQKGFLHSITHEFKSPVASLRLQIETMLQRNLSPQQQQQALNNALEDTERLDKLLEKILVAARIDNGELPMNPQHLNLSENIRQSVATLQRTNLNRKIIENIEENIFLQFDAWAFNSIVINIIENALLYSLQDKPVEVSLEKKDNKIIISVKDYGIGIPPEERKNVFKKFYRTAKSTGYKGTGLGLYLASYFIKKHNGTIQIKDNSPQGTIFEVIFPSHKYPL